MIHEDASRSAGASTVRAPRRNRACATHVIFPSQSVTGEARPFATRLAVTSNPNAIREEKRIPSNGERGGPSGRCRRLRAVAQGERHGDWKESQRQEDAAPEGEMKDVRRGVGPAAQPRAPEEPRPPQSSRGRSARAEERHEVGQRETARGDERRREEARGHGRAAHSATVELPRPDAPVAPARGDRGPRPRSAGPSRARPARPRRASPRGCSRPSPAARPGRRAAGSARRAPRPPLRRRSRRERPDTACPRAPGTSLPRRTRPRPSAPSAGASIQPGMSSCGPVSPDQSDESRERVGTTRRPPSRATTTVELRDFLRPTLEEPVAAFSGIAGATGTRGARSQRTQFVSGPGLPPSAMPYEPPHGIRAAAWAIPSA